jgi:hypothetical protein
MESVSTVFCSSVVFRQFNIIPVKKKNIGTYMNPNFHVFLRDLLYLGNASFLYFNAIFADFVQKTM